MMKLSQKILKSASSHGSEPLMEGDRPPSLMLGVLLVLLIGVLFIVGLVAYQLLEKVNNWHHEDFSARYVNQALVEARALDKQRLAEYRKSDSGTYAIGIDRAKALIAEKASAKAIK